MDLYRMVELGSPCDYDFLSNSMLFFPIADGSPIFVGATADRALCQIPGSCHSTSMGTRSVLPF